jgi:excisionase family DNA binding protein
MDDVPLYKRYVLSIKEAAQYFRIGENKLRRIVAEHRDADFVRYNGNRLSIQREAFEKFYDEEKSV